MASPVNLGAPLPPPPPEPKPKNAAEAAKQFEALLIAQMLRSAREAAGLDQDSTSETMFDVAGQEFAKMIANNGGLGLAKMIATSLETDGHSADTKKTAPQ